MLCESLEAQRGSAPPSHLRSAGVRAGRNSLFMLLAQAGGRIAALLLFLRLTRRLTVAEIGQFSFALTFVGMFTLLTDWGISTWMMREVARSRRESSRWLSAALCGKGLTFVGAVVVGLCMARLTKVAPGVRNVIAILFAGMLPDTFGQTMAYVFLAFERAAGTALVIGLTDWLRLGCVCLILHFNADLPHVAWAYALATAIPPVLFAHYLRGQGVKLMRSSLADVKAVLRNGIPFLLVGVFIRVYLRADTLLLAYLRTDASVGSYNAAYKLMEALIFIPAAFMGALSPLLSRTFRRDAHEFRAGCRMSIRVLSALGVPLAVGTTLLAPRLMGWLYGPRYSGSVLYLQVLIWAAALIFVNASLPVSLNASGRETYTLTVVATGILINVVGNLILIPRLDALGAAIMTVITEVFSTFAYLFFFRRFLFAPGIVGLIWRPLLASVPMGLGVACIPTWPLPAAIAAGALVYGLCLIALGGVRRQDLVLGLAVLGVRS